MADITPFRALRYDLSLAGDIRSLVCPPYDVISEEQRREYLGKNPYQMVRLELPRGEDPYGEAGRTLEEWLSSGILKLDMDPGLYLYEMEYLDRVDHGEKKALRGLICRVRLEDFENGVVLPHEETLTKAKEDRFRLMQATGCNFSQIYSLYQDEKHVTRQRLDRLAQTCVPRYDFTLGAVTHRLWVINDPVAIAALQEDFTPRKLYIADGHHRYETALRYRDWQREQGFACPGAESVMMFLADMEDPGLTVFPTHRLVRGIQGFSEEQFLSACGDNFDVLPQAGREETQLTLDNFYREGRRAFGFTAGSGWHVLALRDETVMDGLLPEKSPAYRHLDVAVLHTLILEKLLGIGGESLADQKNLSYTRQAQEAERSVADGESQCCFLLNPTKVAEIGAVAAAGEKMPQKSTYFYPKLLTGLVMNRLLEN